MEALWEGRSYDALEMARMSQFAENVYFGKPCGHVTDQASVCLGGLALHRLCRSRGPCRPTPGVRLRGPRLCALPCRDVGSSRADLTDAYAAMPQEMQAVAAVFGKR